MKTRHAHRTALAVLLALLSLAGAGACDRKPAHHADDGHAGHTDAPDTAQQAVLHAPADVVPGSYEDWCGEHEVAESLCTRCNPTLVAAFQATGDWCTDHGLPRSQCRTCNPSLVIQRPPQKAAP